MKNKGVIIEFLVLGVVFAVATSLFYYWGLRSYEVSGQVTDLEVATGNQYLVTLDNNQKLTIQITLFMRSEYTPEELYNSLVEGQYYSFLCWGDTPHIYGVAE